MAGETSSTSLSIFWICLIVFLVTLLVILIIGIVMSFRVPEVEDGVFRFLQLDVKHNGALKCDIVVHTVSGWRTKDAGKPTYAKVLTIIRQKFAALKQESWESCARIVGMQIWDDFKIVGVSVEIIVPTDGTEGDMTGATFTRGCASRILKLDA